MRKWGGMMMVDGWMLVVSRLVVISYSRKVGSR